MPNYDYICDDCESTTVENHLYSQRPDSTTCACGGKAEYVISMPNLMTKEAILDGIKRPGFAELRENNKLQRIADNVRDAGDKKKIAAEIRKLGGSNRKESI